MQEDGTHAVHSPHPLRSTNALMPNSSTKPSPSSPPLHLPLSPPPLHPEQAPLAGYNTQVEALRHQEFSRLSGKTYADYGGAPPYPESLIRATTQDLLETTYGNPHSEQGVGEGSGLAASERLRRLTLKLCNADPAQYDVVFTSGATGALKLVAEAFPWTPNSCYYYLKDNHTSVLGIRNVTAQHGAACASLTPTLRSEEGATLEDDAFEFALEICETTPAPANKTTSTLLHRKPQQEQQEEESEESLTQHLFAFPLESNFDGTRYSQQLVTAVQHQHRVRLIHGQLQNQDEPQVENKGVEGNELSLSFLPGGKWRVLLDAAKACATHPPDLSSFPADFVVLSYYKIFGYPTGLGALLIKKDALSTLHKPYFGGGSVTAVLADQLFDTRRPAPAGLEDGSSNFLSIPAALHGFDFIESLGGVAAIDAHACAVANELRARLGGLRHGNGAPICILHSSRCPARQASSSFMLKRRNNAEEHDLDNLGISPEQGLEIKDDYTTGTTRMDVFIEGRRRSVCEGQGPVVTFSLLAADGGAVGYRQVERLAALEGISLRTGCLCNPGACSTALNLTSQEVLRNVEAGYVCWGDTDIINGKSTGVIRLSFGYASSLDDVDTLIAFIQRYFVSTNTLPNQKQYRNGIAALIGDVDAVSAVGVESQGGKDAHLQDLSEGIEVYRVDGIWVYPVKACGGFQVETSWPLGSDGLMFDRHWAIMDQSGQVLTLKRCPGLAALRAMVDLEHSMLSITAPHMDHPLHIPITSNGRSCPKGPDVAVTSSLASNQSPLQQTVKLCGSSILNVQPLSSEQSPHINNSISSSRSSNEGTDVVGIDHQAQDWISTALGIPCRLVRSAPKCTSNHGDTTINNNSVQQRNSFSSSAQLLMVNTTSLCALHAECGSSEPLDVFIQRFRPNIVISPGKKAKEERSFLSFLEHHTKPYSEEGWNGIRFTTNFSISSNTRQQATVDKACSNEEREQAVVQELQEFEGAGSCQRCAVVCKNPSTGVNDGRDILLALGRKKEEEGQGKRLHFGLLLNVKSAGSRSKAAHRGALCKGAHVMPVF